MRQGSGSILTLLDIYTQVEYALVWRTANMQANYVLILSNFLPVLIHLRGLQSSQLFHHNQVPTIHRILYYFLLESLTFLH